MSAFLNEVLYLNRINNDNKRKKNKKILKETDINNKKIKKSKVKQTKKTPTKEKKEKENFSFLKFLIKLFLIILLLIIIISGLFYYKVEQNGGGIRGAIITVLGLSPEEIENLESINILLLGISEDIDSKLTDTIIVCSYNPQNQTAFMLSIPRDTFVGKSTSNAKGSDKINALYAKSPQKLVDKVTEITGIELDYYAVVNNQALIDIVDIIGGVDFEVPIDMDYDDPTQDLHIHLKKGMQKIDGEKAEQLLRFRHNNDGSSYPSSYGDNDYGRMRTQREFISATLNQSINIKNLPRAKQMIDAIFDNLDTDINIDKILPYVPDAIEFDTNTIVSEQLPGESKKLNDLWFFVSDKKATKKIVMELKAESK